MQQVAAHKTDLATLPFATTDTAKAVETGIESQSENQNGDAFKSLYQEAKSASNKSSQQDASASPQKSSNKQYSDRQPDVTSDSADREVKKSSTDTQHDVSHSAGNAAQGSTSAELKESAKKGKDKEAGHTDLPMSHRGDDIAESGDGSENNAIQTFDLHRTGTKEVVQNESVNNVLKNTAPIAETSAVEVPTNGKTEDGEPIVDSPVVGEPIETMATEGPSVHAPSVQEPSDEKTLQEIAVSTSNGITTEDSSSLIIEGSVAQNTAIETQYVIGEGGEKDLEAGTTNVSETEDGLSNSKDVIAKESTEDVSDNSTLYAKESAYKQIKNSELDDNEKADIARSVGFDANTKGVSVEDAIQDLLKSNAGQNIDIENDAQLPLAGGATSDTLDVYDLRENNSLQVTERTTDGSELNNADLTDEGVDWLSFVESIMNGGSDEAPATSDVVNSNNEKTISEHQHESVKSVQSDDTLKTTTDVINSIDDKELYAAIPIVEDMLAALQQGANNTRPDSIANSAEVGSLNENEELVSALNSLKALLQKLTSETGSETESVDDVVVKSNETTRDVANAINATPLDDVPITGTKTDSSELIIDTKAIARIVNNEDILSKLTPEETLVLKLLGDELQSAEQLASEETSSYLNDLTTKLSALNGMGQNAQEAKAGESTASVRASNTTTTGENKNTSTVNTDLLSESHALLVSIHEMPAETAAKATEAFADRMVAAMPLGPQQEVVKNNIIAGINEFQQQIQQGREPGIDLAAIVADAAKEAMVSAEVVSSLNARVESQASQFLQLVNNTQNSVHQVLQGQLTQADTMITESNQIKAESSKSQQQFEGFDKAVNIHKPEGQQQLNEKIRWMVNARNTMAEIRLDPPEMGSMQVRVNVAGEAASVSFIVQSQQAKDALADAMPKLRDMLAEQGIELGDAQVRKDNSSGSENGGQLAGENGQSGRGGRSGDHDSMDDIENGRIVEQAVSRQTVGGIDYYA